MKTTTTTSSQTDVSGIASKIKVESLNELFTSQLLEVYDAEQVMERSFPAIINATATIELKNALDRLMDTSVGHISRLDEAFSALGIRPERRDCLAVRSYMDECENLINATSDVSTRDMALISITQKVEHFEIAAYDSLKIIAKVLGHVGIADLLQASQDEAEETEEMLATLAESCIGNDFEGNFIAYND